MAKKEQKKPENLKINLDIGDHFLLLRIINFKRWVDEETHAPIRRSLL